MHLFHTHSETEFSLSRPELAPRTYVLLTLWQTIPSTEYLSHFVEVTGAMYLSFQ